MPVVYPRLGALVNGQQLSGVIEASVVSCASSDASWYHLACVLSQEPPFDILFWSAAKAIKLEIYAIGEDSNAVSLLQGGVDSITLNLERNIVYISGRDSGSTFLERSSDDSFVNMTASEIVDAIASRHGFGSSVFRTTRIVGRPDSDGKDYIALPLHSRRMSDWDILTDLARQEGCDVYVVGQVLHFQPATASISPTIQISADSTVGLRLTRRPSLSELCRVQVHTWDPWKKMSTTEDAQFPDDAGDAIPSRIFNIVEPGLDTVTAVAIARSQLNTIRAQEYRADFSMLVPVQIQPRASIALYGTSSSFDRTYRIEMVESQYHPSTGFRQRIHAVGLTTQLNPNNF